MGGKRLGGGMGLKSPAPARFWGWLGLCVMPPFVLFKWLRAESDFVTRDVVRWRRTSVTHAD